MRSLLYALAIPLFFAITSIVRAYRQKNKMRARSLYLAAICSFFIFLLGVCVYFNQFGLAMIFTAFAFVVGIVSVPIVKEYNVQRIKKALASVDLSVPPRLRDLFSKEWEWLKFVHKWGAKKTVFVLWLLMTPINGGLLFALNLWLKIMSLGSIVNYTFITSTGTAILCYHALKSALREKPSEVARVRAAYRSLNTEDLFYRKLLDGYMRVWGSRLGGTSALDRNIQSCMKQGLSREEAIRKIAAWEFEGIPWET